jgi:hypothetical protein
MQKMKNLASALIINLAFSFASYSTECEKNFLVIDVGSSTTKGTLYTKDLCNGNRTINKQYFNQNYPYQACLSDSNSKSLPKFCIDGGVQAIESIKEYFKVDCKDNCFAFATGWARYIDNQHDWIDHVSKTGVKPKVVSQDYEGELKLVALKNMFQDKPFIGFDIGGGSFQLVWQDKEGKIHHYNSNYGTDNFTHDIQDKLMSDRVKKCVKARNQINLLKNSSGDKDEMLKAIKKEKELCGKNCAITFSKKKLDDAIAYAQEKVGQPLLAHSELQKFVKENKPVVYADTLLVNLGIKKQLGIEKERISHEDIYKIMQSVSGMHFVEIKSTYPDLPDMCVNTTQPSMLILYTIMKSLGVDEIYGVETDYMDSFINSQIK